MPKQAVTPTGGVIPTEDNTYNIYALSKFAFEVSIGGVDGNVSFQTMDGLGASVAKMEFRDGNSQKFYKQSRPTLTSYDPVTLKKGMFTGDKRLFNWFKNVSSGAMFSDMRTVSIHLSELRGEGLAHIFTWTLEGAYVTKFTPTNLDGEADGDVAVEEMELTYQSFSMDAGGGFLSGIPGLALAAGAIGAGAAIASKIF